MSPSRRPFLPIVPLASFLLAGYCLLGCLLSSCGLGADGENPPSGEHPTDGGNPDAGRGYYTIDLPAASSRLNLDSIYAVKWHATDSAGQDLVRVSLYRNDSLLGPVMGSLQASGTFGLDFGIFQHNQGKPLVSGSGYRLRIVNETDSSKWDFGPFFSLYSDYSGSLELTVPAAGAQIKGDSGIRIAWTSSGKVGDEVRFELYRDTTRVWDMGSTAPAASGEYFWSLVPEWLPSGDGYRFRIYSTSNASIEQMGPAFTLILPALYGTYEFLRPRSGDVWVAGEMGDMEWRVTGNPGSYSGITLWRDSPRELVYGWTPGVTQSYYAGQWTTPANMPSGTYRFRIGSLADTTLFAFSEPFTLQAAGSP